MIIGALLPIALVIVVSSSGPLAADPLLTSDAVARLFSSRDNEEGRPFSLTGVAIVEGAFTAPGTIEAVASFTDTSQSHAAGISEIWLLRLEGGIWEPITKIAESDTAEFVTTDLNGDGALEILTHTSGGNHGYLVTNRRLIYFTEGRPTDLLTFEGFDNTGWAEDGICAFDARFTVKDVNRDAILDVQLTEFYDYCRKEGDTSVFLRRSERTTTFSPVISPSGSIIGIQQMR
jgi:hypothetical protein